ncbi:MAG: hypothetical protein QI199_05385 [Candidatus Korarchaeota archaeon]|nr:hypothetical protein [Candidatus Korarchaeota archaeon]
MRYVLTNPTNHTVTLSRIDDKPGGVLEEISLLVGREGRASKNWSPVAAYMDGNRVPVSVFNLSVAGEIARRAFWVGFLNNATQEFAGMVVLEPELAASFGFRSGYYGQPALLAYVKYGRVEIGPGEAVELSARVYYGEGNYKWLDEAGFWGLSPLLAPEDYRKYRSIADNPGNATSIAEAYAKLKREVEDLRENNTSLQVRVNELEGECHKQLIQLRDYQDLAEHLNKVKASLENQRYLAFIAGMLAGLLVLYLGIKAGALGTGR